MTTQTNLNLEQLPYGREAALISDLLAVPGKIAASLGRFFATLGEAIEMRNRYIELSALDDAALNQLGIVREAIPQVVAAEAGLLDQPVATAANSNLHAVRPAA